jgi:succinate dehydrogenase/fumarate reductase flavoprotein subunit
MTAGHEPQGAGELHCDLLVAGSGAGALSAAVTAAHHGLQVIVAEKDALFGGTTAWSGGWMWVPRNRLARRAGIHEDLSAPLDYLRHELKDQFREGLHRRYLEMAPQMVDFFADHTRLQFIDGNGIPDFHGSTPSAALGGRSVCAAPYAVQAQDREWLASLRPPLHEMTFLGMGIAAGADYRHFLEALRRWASFRHVAARVGRHLWDLLRHGRSQRLVNGHALAGALLASAVDRGVRLLASSPVVDLLQEDGRVVGARLQTPQGPVRVQARRGVVLACGGFPHDSQRRQALLPHETDGHQHHSAAWWGNTGDGLRLGESAGARMGQGAWQSAALAPVSVVQRPDGSVAHFPHLAERAKPGLIAVTADGRRFTNEADSYHDFMQSLLHVCPPGQVQAWLVCDHAFIRHYGLGAVKPAPMPLAPWRSRGYLRTAASLTELASACGIDPQGLADTVARYNRMAAEGVDLDFDKGRSPYNRIQGDAGHAGPNPCMAPITQGPFHAVRIVPGSLGTFAGLSCDGDARALDGQGQVIEGLYACGNDMHAIMGGHYPSGGITLGPAMTFGHLAGLHAAGRTDPDASPRATPPTTLRA